MRHIHFIVNPVSGKGNHIIDNDIIAHHFPKDKYKVQVEYTAYKNHARELTAMAVQQNPDCIIACGGDGTINEVASCIVGTGVQLGIIPTGSGNGLASNLEIPLNIQKAIAVIKKAESAFIDVGRVENHYFFSNMGFGADAMIIKKYEQFKKRSLRAYVKASIYSGFKYKEPRCIIRTRGKIFVTNFFLLFFSNSNEMGYRMSLTPQASLQDGFLNMVVVPRLSFFGRFLLGYHIISNSTASFKKLRQTLVDRCSVELCNNIGTDVQIDGEFHRIETNVIHIDVVKNGLQVLVPKTGSNFLMYE